MYHQNSTQFSKQTTVWRYTCEKPSVLRGIPHAFLSGMEFTKYRLPNGQVIMLDSSATKNAKVTTFTLKGGIVVYAVRADVIAELSRFENVS